MKKITFAFSFISLLLLSACNKDKLNIVNPNSPTAESLLTESGINSFALGLINRQLGNVTNAGSVNLFVVGLVHESTMGDETFQPYGNWGVRWSNQVYSVTLPSGTTVVNPFGVTQLESLKGFNSRQAGDRNAFLYTWFWAYNYIAQCNTLLTALDDPKLSLSGDAATKKSVLKAWALWWKGYAYSRIGSLYIAGLKVDNAGITNPNYLNNKDIIVEANRNLDEAAILLNGITTVNADYTLTYKAITASYNFPNDVITPAMWLHSINTIKARNLIANKKTAVMTPADWTAVLALTNNGIAAADKVFKLGMTPDGVNDVSGNFSHPLALIGTNNEFNFVSERLIQEYKTGDARLSANFTLRDLADRYSPNIRSRGLQFGTRWAVNNVEEGGLYATNNNAGSLALYGSYEENALTAAEALINTSQIENGLALIDQVRTFQNARLAAVSGTGLTLVQAKEELRRERRVALFLRGTSFYDARRWGVTAPVSAGGGRVGGLVYLSPSLIGGGATAPDVRPATLDYRYVDYFDVPLNELDFNIPSATSVPVKN